MWRAGAELLQICRAGVEFSLQAASLQPGCHRAWRCYVRAHRSAQSGIYSWSPCLACPICLQASTTGSSTTVTSSSSSEPSAEPADSKTKTSPLQSMHQRLPPRSPLQGMHEQIPAPRASLNEPVALKLPTVTTAESHIRTWQWCVGFSHAKWFCHDESMQCQQQGHGPRHMQPVQPRRRQGCSCLCRASAFNRVRMLQRGAPRVGLPMCFYSSICSQCYVPSIYACHVSFTLDAMCPQLCMPHVCVHEALCICAITDMLLCWLQV